eukprot:scaffold641252_cov19-Prasinocladus_malaysianus.AAC.1
MSGACGPLGFAVDASRLEWSKWKVHFATAYAPCFVAMSVLFGLSMALQRVGFVRPTLWVMWLYPSTLTRED